MSEELKPCPFCGGEAELKEYKPNVSGVAICKECGARSPICKNDHTGGWKPKAIAEWNTRAELGNGTLTAEQVRESIESRFEVDVWVPKERWQAIADELNATMGGGECVFEINTDATAIKCSSCGYSLPKGTDLDDTRFCGGCGQAVKR